MKKNEYGNQEKEENGLIRLFAVALLGIFVVGLSYVIAFIVVFGGTLILPVLGKPEKARFDLVDIHVITSLISIFFTFILIVEEDVGRFLVRERIKRDRLLASTAFFLGAYIVTISYLWYPDSFFETLPYGLITIALAILIWLSYDMISRTKRRRFTFYISLGILITVGVGYQVWRTVWDLLQAVKLGLPIIVLVVLLMLLSDVTDWLKAVNEIVEAGRLKVEIVRCLKNISLGCFSLGLYLMIAGILFGIVTGQYLFGIVIGLVSLIAIYITTNQAIRTKSYINRLSRSYVKLSSSKRLEEALAGIATWFNASISLSISTLMVLFMLPPNTWMAPIIVLIIILVAVVSASTWLYVYFHHYDLTRYDSIHKLKLEHGMWLEIVRILAIGSIMLVAGFVVSGAVAMYMEKEPLEFYPFSYSLAIAVVYVYVGLLYGIVFPIFRHLDRIRNRIESIDRAKPYQSCKSSQKV